MDEVVRFLAGALSLPPDQVVDYLGKLVSAGVGIFIPFLPKTCRGVRLLCFLALGAFVALFRRRPSEVVQAILNELNNEAEWEPQSRLLVTSSLAIHEVDINTGTIGLVKANGVALPAGLPPRDHRMIASAVVSRARKLQAIRDENQRAYERLKNEESKHKFLSAMKV